VTETFGKAINLASKMPAAKTRSGGDKSIISRNEAALKMLEMMVSLKS